MSSLTLYFHTLRHLRPIQIAARAWLHLYRPLPDTRAPPAPRPSSARYEPPVAPETTLLGPDVFRLLNVERRCTVASDWRPHDAPKLWTYHLHYFDDLNARDAPLHIQEAHDLGCEETLRRCNRRQEACACPPRRRRGAQIGSRPMEPEPPPRGDLYGTQVADGVEVQRERTQPRTASPSATVTRATSRSSSRGIGAPAPFLTASTKARTQAL